jgi:general secretion pathway protein F
VPRFTYVAIDPAGEVRRGTMEAADEATVVQSLQRQGHTPMRAEPADARGPLAALLSLEIGGRQGLPRQELTDVTRELATMLAAGQDLDRALRFAVDTAPTKRRREVLERVREKVRGGSSLAAALANEPASFPRLYVGLVRAGEAGGALAETLQRLAELLERERSLALAVQSALVYPAVLVVAGTLSIAFLIGYVLPQFVPMFVENGVEIPFATRVLLGIGTLVTQGGPWIIAVLVLLYFAARQALAQPRVRRIADGMILRVPLFGPILREGLAARFARTFGSLLRNGVPLIGALSIVEDTLGNQAAVEAVRRASDSAKGGAGLSRPLEISGVFPARLVHLLRLGEETARLSETALQAAEIHEDRLRARIQRLMAIMVPAITLAMGLAVAGIVASLLTAMLSVNDLAF